MQLLFLAFLCYYNFETIAFKNIEKEFGHPNVEGMRAICNQVFDAITKNE